MHSKYIDENSVMHDKWYIDLSFFLLVPVCGALTSYFLPIYHHQAGLSRMALFPLFAGVAYSITTSPNKKVYGCGWNKAVSYFDFVFAKMRRVITFTCTAGLLAIVAAKVLTGFSKEVVMLFDASIWAVATPSLIFCAIALAREVRKLKKERADSYQSCKNTAIIYCFITILVTYIDISKGFRMLTMLLPRV